MSSAQLIVVLHMLNSFSYKSRCKRINQRRNAKPQTQIGTDEKELPFSNIAHVEGKRARRILGRYGLVEKNQGFERKQSQSLQHPVRPDSGIIFVQRHVCTTTQGEIEKQDLLGSLWII
ncbi:hypothetical protein C5167_029359 [Papaver somniferum]|nr:hypothetical protein C5167_029359 [Papaver somniferum]